MDTEIILLNGPSSSGKSSIAKKLNQGLRSAGIDSVIISLDDYLQMSPEQPIWEDDVFEVIPSMYAAVLLALKDHKTVILDHVITSARIFDALAGAVHGHKMKTVRVVCDPKTLNARESERGDRFPGSAEMSLKYLYPKDGYDMCIDSEKADPSVLAELILDRLNENEHLKVIRYYESERQEHWLAQIAKSDWSAGVFLHELLSKGTFFDAVGRHSEVLLLTDGDELVSFCTLAEKDDVQPTDLTPWMGFVYTFPQYRGRHRIGLLFDEIARIAKEKSFHEVYISTNHTGLYEKYGCVYKTTLPDMDGNPSRVYIKRFD